MPDGVGKLRRQILAAVITAAVSHLNDPRLSTTARGIKSYRCLMKIEEHILHEIFSLASVAEDFESNAQNKAVVAVEQNRERLIVREAEMIHQIIIVEPMELAKRQSARLRKRIASAAKAHNPACSVTAM